MSNAKKGDHDNKNSKKIVDLELAPVSISEVLGDAIVIYHQKILDKNIKIEIECEEGKYFIQAEKYSFLNNVFNNNLSNAIKFSPPKGVIKVCCQELNKEVHLSVIDNGEGIPQEAIERIYQNTQALPKLGTLGESGAGNGLIIAKSFLELFEGKIYFEKLPTGTKVTLVFPICSAP